jgi:hypothetical protein
MAWQLGLSFPGPPGPVISGTLRRVLTFVLMTALRMPAHVTGAAQNVQLSFS